MDKSNTLWSWFCKGIQGKQSNRRVISELLIGQSFTQLWHMKSLSPSQVMTLETWLCGNDFQVVSCHIYRQKHTEHSVKELVRSLKQIFERCLSSFSQLHDVYSQKWYHCCWGVTGACVRMWLTPQSAERHSETCGLGTGNFHFRCEPRLSSVNAGVENFHQYYAIPVNEKIKCIQLTKCVICPFIPLEVMVQEVKQALLCCFRLQTSAVVGPCFGNTINILEWAVVQVCNSAGSVHLISW